MPGWVIIILVVLALVAVYLISALILFLLMKRAMKKAYDALMALLPYEDERMKLVLDVKERLLNDNFHLSEEMCEATENNCKLLQETPVDVSKVKNQTDFLLMYYMKFLKEKKLVAKSAEYKELYDTMLSKLHLKDELKNSPYGKYDKLAFRYNSYLGMIILAPFVRRKYQNAPIL